MRYLNAKNRIRSSIPGPTGRPEEIEIERAFRTRQLQAAKMNPKGWPWQRRTQWVRNDGGYETGSVSATQDARNVYLSGGTFPDPCAGWIIAFSEAEEESYRVESRTGTTAIVIDRPYEGDTGQGKQYNMYDPYCRAPNDLHAWAALSVEADGRPLIHEPMGFVRGRWAKQITLGEGWIETLGPPSDAAGYEAGTVTVAKGSAAVTGSSTTFPAWIAGHHFQVAGEDILYKIKQWDSATALTLTRAYGGGNAASGKSYGIDPPGAIRMEIHYPREHQFALKVDYWAMPEEHINDTDIIEGDEAYAAGLIDLATADVLMTRIDKDSMTEGMVNELLMRIKMYKSRGMEMLSALMDGAAPLPEADATLQDIRWDSGPMPRWTWTE